MKEVFEKIIEKLEEAKSNVPVNRLLDDIIKEKPKELGQLIAYDKAIEIVKQEAEQYKGGWIPVSEKLPEESLNSVIGWDEYRERCCFVQYIGGRWILGNDIDSVKIIAWQPLPQPYHEKGEMNG